MNASAQLNGLKRTLSTFWEERNQRERMLLVVAMVVIVVGLFYALLIDPAMSGRRDLEKRLPALRQQAAEVQALAKEAAAFSGKATASVPAMTRESLEASLARRGLKAQNVAVTGDQAKVQMTAVSFAGVVDWLDEMQKTARLTVTDANIDAQEKLDTVNATFTLRQQRGEGGQ